MTAFNEGDIQLFVVPPRGPTKTVLINPTCTTPGDLRRTIAPYDEIWDDVKKSACWSPQAIRFSVDGKPILDETATLRELGITDGSVVRTSARLKGGASMSFVIKTKFGCLCCGNHLTYDFCKSGRRYNVTVSSIENVSAIFDAIASENPKWSEKKMSGTLLTKKGLVLDPDRKVLFYDLRNNEELWLQLAPCYWFIGAFRKTPQTTTQEEEEEEAEFQRAVEAGKNTHKKKVEENSAVNPAVHEDEASKGVEDIDLGNS